MGYALNWRRVAREFENDYQVLAYDSRGHGRSVHATASELQGQPSPYSPEGLANDLRKILDDLGWNKITLVGHSMGGRVAYTFAYFYPERVEKLVIVDIGPNMSPATGSTVLKILDEVPVPFASKLDAKEWFDSEFPRLFSHLSTARALALWLYANIVEDSSGRAVWRFDEVGIRAAVTSGHERERWVEIEGLKMPTLVIRGARSTDLPKDVYEKMLKANPHIRGVEIPDTGHWVHSEKFHEFVAELGHFLREPQSE